MMMTNLATVLRNAGLTVVEAPGWETLGRNTFNPQGTVGHIDVIPPTWPKRTAVTFLQRGRSDLPGPLYNLWIDRDGMVHVLAAGKANHAGKGGWMGQHGNSSMLGWCLANDGRGEEYTEAQLAVAPVVVAAVHEEIDAPRWMACSHDEWTPRKTDPPNFDMAEFRIEVEALLVEVPPLKDFEITQLRRLIASWERVGSNPTFPQYLITDYRERKRK